jgi:hypothetical protein
MSETSEASAKAGPGVHCREPRSFSRNGSNPQRKPVRLSELDVVALLLCAGVEPTGREGLRVRRWSEGLQVAVSQWRYRERRRREGVFA